MATKSDTRLLSGPLLNARVQASARREDAALALKMMMLWAECTCEEIIVGCVVYKNKKITGTFEGECVLNKYMYVSRSRRSG